MVDISITINDKKIRKDLEDLGRNILPLALRPIHIAAQWIAGQIQKNYLRGPRPERLTVDSSRLIGSISSSAGIEGNEIIGHVGTNVRSDTGFNYPEYWEHRGTKHGGPRPFLQPARDDNRAKWLKIFEKELRVRVEKWLNAKASSTT